MNPKQKIIIIKMRVNIEIKINQRIPKSFELKGEIEKQIFRKITIERMNIKIEIKK